MTTSSPAEPYTLYVRYRPPRIPPAAHPIVWIEMPGKYIRAEDAIRAAAQAEHANYRHPLPPTHWRGWPVPGVLHPLPLLTAHSLDLRRTWIVARAELGQLHAKPENT